MKKEESNYTEIITRLKQEVESARLNAALSVNKQMLFLYWRIGRTILEQQESQGWGAKVIIRLTGYIHISRLIFFLLKPVKILHYPLL